MEATKEHEVLEPAAEALLARVGAIAVEGFAVVGAMHPDALTRLSGIVLATAGGLLWARSIEKYKEARQQITADSE
jgi:hypothetical protein